MKGMQPVSSRLALHLAAKQGEIAKVTCSTAWGPPKGMGNGRVGGVRKFPVLLTAPAPSLL